jgi:hypothetical protein
MREARERALGVRRRRRHGRGQPLDDLRCEESGPPPVRLGRRLQLEIPLGSRQADERGLLEAPRDAPRQPVQPACVRACGAQLVALRAGHRVESGNAHDDDAGRRCRDLLEPLQQRGQPPTPQIRAQPAERLAGADAEQHHVVARHHGCGQRLCCRRERQRAVAEGVDAHLAPQRVTQLLGEPLRQPQPASAKPFARYRRPTDRENAERLPPL